MATYCERNELNLYIRLNKTKELNEIYDLRPLSKEAEVLIQLLSALMYVATFLLNLGVLVSILYRKSLQSPMNLLLFNISLAHIIAGAGNMLFTFVLDTGQLSIKPSTRNILCGLTEGNSVYYIGSGAYLLTLCVISFNRYLAIKYPTKQHLRMSKDAIIRFNALVWLISFAWTIPSSISWKYNDYLQLCTRSWDFIKYPLVYRVSLVLWSFILPFGFLLLSFVAILWKRKENRNTFVFDKNSALIHKLHLQKAEILLGLLTMTFLITWMPFFIYWSMYTAGYFKSCRQEMDSIKWTHFATFASTLNGIIDPLLIANASKEIKRSMLGIYRKMIGQTNNRICDEVRSIDLQRRVNTIHQSDMFSAADKPITSYMHVPGKK